LLKFEIEKMISLFNKKTPEEKINSLEKKIDKYVSKNKLKKCEKAVEEYNLLIDLLRKSPPTKRPFNKIESVKHDEHSKEISVSYTTEECEFCGSEGYPEILPYFFGTIIFKNVCKGKLCRKAFEIYRSNYLETLGIAEKDLTEYWNKLWEE